jgi:ferritin-like metal-binding protein YciE
MMDQAGDAYAGFMPREELIALLNTLAEAERAGVKVVQSMRDEAADEELRALLEHVRHDEARYCGMVSRMVEQLGGTPSRETGAFYGKVMALDGVEARLALLNRGQGWVVRKLEEVLPKLRDDTMHAALKEMIDTHNANISACDRVLGA